MSDAEPVDTPELPFHETDGLLKAGGRIQEYLWDDSDDEDDDL